MVYVFLAQGFEEIEALTVVDILRRAQIDVTTVGVGGKEITGAHNITVLADKDLSEISLSFTQMIVLPGGMPGTLNLEASDIVQDAIKHCLNNGKYIGAICAAPSILGHMGALRDKKAVCYPGFEKDLEGAQIVEQSVCRDGNIITAKGPGAAMDFALELLAALRGMEVVQEIKKALQYEK